MNFKHIAKLLGNVLIFVACFMILSLSWAIYYREYGTIIPMGVAGLIMLLVGYLLFLVGKGESGDISRREALFVVAASWFSVGFFGGFPFLFLDALPSITDSTFEALAGFTGTGATVLTDIESLPHALLFWRSLTHWLGGMGIIVLFVAIFPYLGVGGKFLFKSESTGSISAALRPQIKETAIVLWGAYVFFTIAETILLKCFGMSLFDALCHSFGTIATGGFSTKNASIAAFDSVQIEIIIIIFMLIGGINFSLYFFLWKGNWREALGNRELHIFLISIFLAVIAVTVNIAHIYPEPLEALRHAAFQVVSIHSTTGYCTDNFNLYPPFSKALLLILMVVGGCGGSTGGGIKMFRAVVIFKAMHLAIYKRFKPAGVKAIRVGKAYVNPEMVKPILALFVIFAMVFVVCTLFMTAMGLDLITASTSVIATLNCIGPGLGQVGAVENYAFINHAGKIVLIFCMVMGRLEYFTILVLFLPVFWKD